MTIHHGERRGEMWRERREMEGWGLGEVKGQRKKGGTFSEDGRLEKKQGGDNNSHV